MEVKHKDFKVATIYLTQDELTKIIKGHVEDETEIWPDRVVLEGDFHSLSNDLRVDLYRGSKK